MLEVSWLEQELEFRNHLSKAAIVRFFSFRRVCERELFPRGIGEVIKEGSHNSVDRAVSGEAKAEVFKILGRDIKADFLLLCLLGFIWGLRF